MPVPVSAPAAALTLLLLALAPAARAADPAEAPAIEAEGAALYHAHCANCHGTFGEGDGAVAPALPVVLLDLRYLSERNGGRFPRTFVTDIIDGRETRAAHGPEAMPTWGAEFARDGGAAGARIDALVSYLEAIQQSD